ncbi:MAG TPA: S8 family serine peptidase [Bryobacteraceae bacterium]|nr:S8 family serine peptidase [Bryobacteraceae bacterium]
MKIAGVLTAALLLASVCPAAQTPNASPAVVPQSVTAVKVVLANQADLSGAFALTTKAARGQYVYNALTTLAAQTQPAVLQAISQMGLIGTPYYIANFILVQAPAGQTISSLQLSQLQGRPDVASIESVTTFNTNLPAPNAPAVSSLPPGRGIEKNIQFINAPAVWAQGVQGQGVTIGFVDTGVQTRHPLLRANYRGKSSTGNNDNFNWWDAVHATLTSGSNPCGTSSSVPCDDTGHGTHITGTALGGNGNDYQIGVAPQAKFIACRDMDRGYATTGANFEECMQFMLAPWDLTGQNADYTKAPDIVVHPYHCSVPGASCVDDPVMHMVYWNLYAAGITSVVAAEDSGSICGSQAAWPQTYPMAVVVGALDYDEGDGNPAITIAPYSSIGLAQGSVFKPGVASPGTQILSASLNGNVALMTGTSVAAAQVAGSFALAISANPFVQGKPEQLWRLVGGLNPKLVDVGTCGTPSGSPNLLYGWGNLDASVLLHVENIE